MTTTTRSSSVAAATAVVAGPIIFAVGLWRERTPFIQPGAYERWGFGWAELHVGTLLVVAGVVALRGSARSVPRAVLGIVALRVFASTLFLSGMVAFTYAAESPADRLRVLNALPWRWAHMSLVSPSLLDALGNGPLRGFQPLHGWSHALVGSGTLLAVAFALRDVEPSASARLRATAGLLAVGCATWAVLAAAGAVPRLDEPGGIALVRTYFPAQRATQDCVVRLVLWLGLATDAALASALGAGRLFGAARRASTNPAEPDQVSVGATATNLDGADAQAGAPVPVSEHATPRPQETRERNARDETAGGVVAHAWSHLARRLGRLAARWWVGPVAGGLLACAIVVASAGFQWRRARLVCDACCDTSSAQRILRVQRWMTEQRHPRLHRGFGFTLEDAELAQGIGPFVGAACVCTDQVAVLAFRGRIINEQLCE